MAKGKKKHDSEDVEYIDLRQTSSREKAFLRDFEEKFSEEDEGLTVKEMLEAKKAALIKFRESAEDNIHRAQMCAAELLGEEEEEE